MDLLPPSILPVLQTLVGKQLRSRDQGVETAVGRHRTCCLEMRILLFVTVMIARVADGSLKEVTSIGV